MSRKLDQNERDDETHIPEPDVLSVGGQGLDIHSRPVLIYRWFVFAMSAGYLFYQIVTADYSHSGGPFRFLTIWALMLSFYASSRMLARSEYRSDRPHEITAMCAAVLNTMVVFLYWKLFFTDPALVNGNGDIAWHQQYYLHGLGPALQLFDTLFIARAFRKPWRAAPVLLAIIAAYVTWSEVFVQNINDFPVGTVTNGLPYPFLNSMEITARLYFYGTNGLIGLILLGAYAVLMRLIWQFLPTRAPTNPSVPNDSRDI